MTEKVTGSISTIVSDEISKSTNNYLDEEEEVETGVKGHKNIRKERLASLKIANHNEKQPITSKY